MTRKSCPYTLLQPQITASVFHKNVYELISSNKMNNGKGWTTNFSRLIRVAVVGSTSACHDGDQAASPAVSHSTPNGTRQVCWDSLSTEMDGWDAGLMGRGKRDSPWSVTGGRPVGTQLGHWGLSWSGASVCELCTIFCHMDHRHWMSQRFL